MCGFAIFLVLGLFSGCAADSSVHGQVRQLHPVDEAVRDPSFFLFRARLIEAVAQRDTQFVYDHIAPDVAIGFGGGGGLADFTSMWRPAAPDSELWPVLARILSRGGLFQSGTKPSDSLHRFVAPYTFAAFPDDLDPYISMIVTGENVRVRAEPSATGAVIDTISYRILPLHVNAQQEVQLTGDWRRVALPSGTPGYVAAEYLTSPLDYRAGFERRNGRWMLTFLVAGD